MTTDTTNFSVSVLTTGQSSKCCPRCFDALIKSADGDSSCITCGYSGLQPDGGAPGQDAGRRVH